MSLFYSLYRILLPATCRPNIRPRNNNHLLLTIPGSNNLPGSFYSTVGYTIMLCTYRVAAAGTAYRRSRHILLYSCTPVCWRTSLLSRTAYESIRNYNISITIITYFQFILYMFRLTCYTHIPVFFSAQCTH